MEGAQRGLPPGWRAPAGRGGERRGRLQRARLPPGAPVHDTIAEDFCTFRHANLTPVATYLRRFSALKDGKGAARGALGGHRARWRGRQGAQPVLDRAVTVAQCGLPHLLRPRVPAPGDGGLFDPALENLDSICQPTYHDSLVAIAGAGGQFAEHRGDEPAGSAAPDRGRHPEGRDPGVLLGVQRRISYEPATGTASAKVHFLGTCQRRIDDQKIEVR